MFTVTGTVFKIILFGYPLCFLYKNSRIPSANFETVSLIVPVVNTAQAGTVFTNMHKFNNHCQQFLKLSGKGLKCLKEEGLKKGCLYNIMQ